MKNSPFQNAQNHQILIKLLRILVDGKDNTREFLSMASQYLELGDYDVPTYQEIVDFYESVKGKEV